MAISKKYSRRIVVDGVAYRWRIPPEVVYDQTGYDGRIVVSVWPEEESGQMLRLIGGYPSSETGLPTESITPRRVAAGIRAALHAGWQPATPNHTFRFNLPPVDEL